MLWEKRKKENKIQKIRRKDKLKETKDEEVELL